MGQPICAKPARPATRIFFGTPKSWNASCYVTVITGGDPANCKDRALAAGATSFFHKPFDSDELLAVIRQTLGEDQAKPQPAATAASRPGS
jgi:DNA-binding response OmpR family regulator